MITNEDNNLFLSLSYNKIEKNFAVRGNLPPDYQGLVENLLEKKIVSRIWEKDFTVWREDPEEISNRLGWLNSPENTLSKLHEIKEFVSEIKERKFKNILLLGMGGSSLTPEMFSNIFGPKESYPELKIIDSTSPDTLNDFTQNYSPKDTLYIVSTKSGGTVETLSLMKYFYHNAVKTISEEYAGKHFVAITDPGSGLEKMATDLKFRKIFLNDPNIGGRYSGLSLFGMVPAALCGIDIEKVLNFTVEMISDNKSASVKNSGALLGTIIGHYANKGKDKLTFFLSKELKDLGGWLEQLIAESTGKDGKGILPVDLEEIVNVDNYSRDRIFTIIRLSRDHSFEEIIEQLKENNFPVIEIILNEIDELGGEMFRWEMITIIASHMMDVQPFDQPNVESAKIVARAMVKEYMDKGELPKIEYSIVEDNLSLLGDVQASTIAEAVEEFLTKLNKGENEIKGRSYLSIQSFVSPDQKVTQAFQALRTKLQKKYKIATTFGYGPRFLHSTGQLHKGDAGHGLFIQFTSDYKNDIPIPDEAKSEKSSISFDVLITAQAMGDRQALLENDRKVINLHIAGEVAEEINNLVKVI